MCVVILCICCCSVTKSCPTLWDPMDCNTPGFLSFSISWCLLKLMSMSPWCHSTISSSVVRFSSCLQSFQASVFSNESVLHIRWPKHWSFSFSIGPSNEYSGLISFRIDWLDLLAVQGTLKVSFPTPQFESINSLVLSLVYSPTLTSVHDYWKNHSFDYTDLCQQSNVSAF